MPGQSESQVFVRAPMCVEDDERNPAALMDLRGGRRLGTIRELQNESMLDRRASDASLRDQHLDTYASFRASELDEQPDVGGTKSTFYNTLQNPIQVGRFSKLLPDDKQHLTTTADPADSTRFDLRVLPQVSGPGQSNIKSMQTVQQTQQEFIKNVRHYQQYRGAVRDPKVTEIFGRVQKPERQKVRSFVSKDLETTRSAMEAQISRSFYAQVEHSGFKKSVNEPENQSQSTRAGGPNSFNPRHQAQYRSCLAGAESVPGTPILVQSAYSELNKDSVLHRSSMDPSVSGRKEQNADSTSANQLQLPNEEYSAQGNNRPRGNRSGLSRASLAGSKTPNLDASHQKYDRPAPNLMLNSVSNTSTFVHAEVDKEKYPVLAAKKHTTAIDPS